MYMTLTKVHIEKNCVHEVIVYLTHWTVLSNILKENKIRNNRSPVTVALTMKQHGGHSWIPSNQRRDQVSGGGGGALASHFNIFDKLHLP